MHGGGRVEGYVSMTFPTSTFQSQPSSFLLISLSALPFSVWGQDGPFLFAYRLLWRRRTARGLTWRGKCRGRSGRCESRRSNGWSVSRAHIPRAALQWPRPSSVPPLPGSNFLSVLIPGGPLRADHPLVTYKLDTRWQTFNVSLPYAFLN